jgi:hypothetical protein
MEVGLGDFVRRIPPRRRFPSLRDCADDLKPGVRIPGRSGYRDRRAGESQASMMKLGGA